MTETKSKKLLILYATQTGNAMDAAERVGREADHRGCPASVLSVDEYDASLLPLEDMVVFVVSTTGQGDPPDSMKVFWRFLLQRNLNQHWLEGVRYAVFGLGDSGYQKYNVIMFSLLSNEIGIYALMMASNILALTSTVMQLLLLCLFYGK